MNDYNKKWFYLAILSLIWGSSFILIKKGLVGLNSVQLASLRMIFAASVIYVYSYKRATNDIIKIDLCRKRQFAKSNNCNNFDMSIIMIFLNWQ